MGALFQNPNRRKVLTNPRAALSALGRLDTLRKSELLEGKQEPWVDWYRAVLPKPEFMTSSLC